MVAWGGGVPAVPGPCQWPGSPQLCPHPWDPGDGTRIPGCACSPPPQNAGGRGYHPYMLPPPMVGGGHTISTAPLCLGRVMGHRASPPPGTSPIQEGTELCWGHRVGSDPPPPPGVGLGACAPPKGYPHSFPPSCSESGCAEKCGGGTCVPSMPPPPPQGRGPGAMWGSGPPLTPVPLFSPGGGFAPAPRGAEDFSGEGFNLGNNDWALR